MLPQKGTKSTKDEFSINLNSSCLCFLCLFVAKPYIRGLGLGLGVGLGIGSLGLGAGLGLPLGLGFGSGLDSGLGLTVGLGDGLWLGDVDGFATSVPVAVGVV